jgi:hypothetical protein
MRLRQAKKILAKVEEYRHNDEQICHALRRWNRTTEAKEADDLWNEVATQLRRRMFPQPTPEEALRAYIDTVPVELSEERIQEIVDYAVGRSAAPN